MYAKIFFFILIIFILLYILYNQFKIFDDINLINKKIHAIKEESVNLIKAIDNTKVINKEIDLNKIFKESDDSECYINNKSDFDKSVICYQSNMLQNNHKINNQHDNPITLPLGSFVDVFLQKCLNKEEEKNDDMNNENELSNKLSNNNINLLSHNSDVSSLIWSVPLSQDSIYYPQNELSDIDNNTKIKNILSFIKKDDISRKEILKKILNTDYKKNNNIIFN